MPNMSVNLNLNTNYGEIRRWKRRKRVAIGFVAAFMGIVAYLYRRKRPRQLTYVDEEHVTNIRAKQQVLRDIYQGSNVHYYDSLHLTKRSFLYLCSILRERGGLHDTLNMKVEESIALFLLILGHGTKMRLIRSSYGWSLETISRHFNVVLRAIISLSNKFIKLPDPSIEQPEEAKWRGFEDCLGTLDGTHIEVLVSLADQGRYRNRKRKVTTNVLGVCDRRMKFVYVLAGWEGLASHSRVLHDAMTRQDGFAIPNGKYYLADAGYINCFGFLAPYRSTRYHLNEWVSQGNNPSTLKELFNLRHASARNIIERVFGLLKMRWAIIRNNSFFDIQIQIHIINAYCIFHNFRQRDMDNILLHQVHSVISIAYDENQEEPNMIRHIQLSNEWNNFRDAKANKMFAEYQARRGQQF